MTLKTENPFAATLRIMRGNTPQGVFAQQLGLKQAIYSHYENRRREPTLDVLIKIARALGTTPNVLLGFESPPLRDSAPHPSSDRLRGSLRSGDIRETNIKGSFNVVGDGNTVVAPPSSLSSTKKGKRK